MVNKYHAGKFAKDFVVSSAKAAARHPVAAVALVGAAAVTAAVAHKSEQGYIKSMSKKKKRNT